MCVVPMQCLLTEPLGTFQPRVIAGTTCQGLSLGSQYVWVSLTWAFPLSHTPFEKMKLKQEDNVYRRNLTCGSTPHIHTSPFKNVTGLKGLHSFRSTLGSCVSSHVWRQQWWEVCSDPITSASFYIICSFTLVHQRLLEGFASIIGCWYIRTLARRNCTLVNGKFLGQDVWSMFWAISAPYLKVHESLDTPGQASRFLN